MALAAQTHIPEAGWLAQWLSDCVPLAFQLRRPFATPAFSAFVSTGWLAGRLALVHMLCLWLYYLNPLSIPLFTCPACGPHSSNPYPRAPNYPHCTTHPATLHHPTHPHCTTHPLTLLVTLTTQTHSPAPCSYALLLALTTQTHSPVAGWLAQ